MSMDNWQPAELAYEGWRSDLQLAVHYRGLVIYPIYDAEFGGFGDDWAVMFPQTGRIILTLWGEEERVFVIAARLARMLNWQAMTHADWKTISHDPAFLAFMAEHYREVTIAGPDSDDLETIVPYRDDPSAARVERRTE